MKRRVLWLLVVLVLAGAGAWVYAQYFSTPAQIRAASIAFMRAAVSGDEMAIRERLAPDAPMTAGDISQLYKGHTFDHTGVHPLRALPNGSRVTRLANMSTVDPSHPGSTRLGAIAFKRVEGHWLIYKVGAGFDL